VKTNLKTEMKLLDKLKWRYATKAMNGKRVTPAKIDNILESPSLAPSSSGLQPYEIIVITNQEVKDKIKPIAWNQPVISDCSHVLVFATWDTYTADRINKVFDLTIKVRASKNVDWESYRQLLLDNYPQKDAEESFNHAAKKTYIALAMAITAAAFRNVDSTPMEGFDANALDEFLELRKKGLRSCVILAVGYRDVEKDWLVNLVKVRKPIENLVTIID
jgi:nitroreductase/dihydropteridine reductase